MTVDRPGLTPEVRERYRVTPLPRIEGCHLCLPEEVADFLEARVVAAHRNGEYLGAVFVDDLARPLAFCLPYLGYLGGLRVDPRSFLVPGMMLEAEGLLLFHHRPSESPLTTRSDLQVARRVRRAGELAGVRALDYLVLGDGGWLSLRHQGYVRFLPLGEPAKRDGRRRVAPKFRNPERPGQTWSGRGKMARWLKRKLAAGARLEEFAVGE